MGTSHCPIPRFRGVTIVCTALSKAPDGRIVHAVVTDATGPVPVQAKYELMPSPPAGPGPSR